MLGSWLVLLRSLEAKRLVDYEHLGEQRKV
jgi:hypothetical protein